MAGEITAMRPESLLDITAGTGDIALRVAKRAPAIKIVMSEVSPEMLTITKLRMAKDSTADFKLLNAHARDEVATESVDAYSISFGMNICDRSRVLA